MEMVGGCCVCLDERGWDENPLVYCDGKGCNVAVHQACYGIVKVPSGPWFCCKCQSTERVARVKCELCPYKEGALKRTDNGGWAHVVCALYIPEVRFGNVTTMEPIKMSSVPNERFLKTCYLCEEAGRDSKTSNGACMSCNKPGCKLSFHVTCAQAKRMLCEEAGHYGNVQYVGYCAQHWAKKFGSKNAAAAELERKSKDKKRMRQDSVSSADGSVPKQKKKEKNLNCTASKSGINASGVVETVASSEKSAKKMELDGPMPILARAGSAEKSAAESLNMLQQMASAKDYFANNNGPKTPLNSFIAAEASVSSIYNNEFDMANILNSQKSKSSKKQGLEEFVDVETCGSADSLHSEIDKKQKSEEKIKSSSAQVEKRASQSKKPGPSQQKSTLQQKSTSHSKQTDAKKRSKSVLSDPEKALKRKKMEEKRKAKRKLEKQKGSNLPRPSKINLFEDNQIPSLFPRNLGGKNPESFQDLLEYQWNQGARFLIQKATHYDVGSLLSCLYQLRAENDDLERRLEQLSARRDRLIAATTRLSTPLADSTDSERPVPLSAMLAKLKSEPADGKTPSKDRDSAKSKEGDSSPNVKKSSMLNGLSKKNGQNGAKDTSHCSDTSLDDLDCKEVLSEDNSLNTPPRETKTNRPNKKEQKQKSDVTDNDRNENGARPPIQSPLVQPPIANPTDPHMVGAITAGRHMQNPAEFIQQMMRQQQSQNSYGSQPHRPPANLLDFINGHTNIMGNFKVNGHPDQNRDSKSTNIHQTKP